MKKRSILLVEDNSDDESLTLRALRKSGVLDDVVVVRDGAEAIERLLGEGTKGTLPFVVFLDLKLPKVGGLDVLRRIRSDERTKCLPVVILTSSKEARDIADSYTCGANSYVRKPADVAQFAKAIEQLGLYWMLLNEPPPRVGGG